MGCGRSTRPTLGLTGGIETPTPPTSGGTNVSKGPNKPPDRSIGMLGPDTPDDFGEFEGFLPPAARSAIERFSIEDAIIALDGAGTYEAALQRHNGDVAKAKGDVGHGYHRYGLGIKRSEFREGWSEADVVDLVNAIVDNPSWAEDDPSAAGFYLYGAYGEQFATLAVRPYGRWIVAAVIPDDLRYSRSRG